MSGLLAHCVTTKLEMLQSALLPYRSTPQIKVTFWCSWAWLLSFPQKKTSCRCCTSTIEECVLKCFIVCQILCVWVPAVNCWQLAVLYFERNFPISSKKEKKTNYSYWTFLTLNFWETLLPRVCFLITYFAKEEKVSFLTIHFLHVTHVALSQNPIKK